MSGSRRRRATRTTRPAARATASGPPGRSLPPSGMGADRRRRHSRRQATGPLRSRPRGLDGRPFRAQQWDVTPKRNIVMALALAVAVTPALAAEHGGRATPPVGGQRRAGRPGPPAPPPAPDRPPTPGRPRLPPRQGAPPRTPTPPH